MTYPVPGAVGFEGPTKVGQEVLFPVSATLAYFLGPPEQGGIEDFCEVSGVRLACEKIINEKDTLVGIRVFQKAGALTSGGNSSKEIEGNSAEERAIVDGRSGRDLLLLPGTLQQGIDCGFGTQFSGQGLENIGLFRFATSFPGVGEVSDPVPDLGDFPFAQLAFWGHMGISSGMKLGENRALVWFAREQDRTIVSALQKTLERAQIKATLLFGSPVPFDAVLFQQWSQICELASVTAARQEKQDEEDNGANSQGRF